MRSNVVIIGQHWLSETMEVAQYLWNTEELPTLNPMCGKKNVLQKLKRNKVKENPIICFILNYQ